MDLVGEDRIRVYGDTDIWAGRMTNTAHHLGRRIEAAEWTTDVFLKRDDR